VADGVDPSCGDERNNQPNEMRGGGGGGGGRLRRLIIGEDSPTTGKILATIHRRWGDANSSGRRMIAARRGRPRIMDDHTSWLQVLCRRWEEQIMMRFSVCSFCVMADLSTPAGTCRSFFVLLRNFLKIQTT